MQYHCSKYSLIFASSVLLRILLLLGCISVVLGLSILSLTVHGLSVLLLSVHHRRLTSCNAHCRSHILLGLKCCLLSSHSIHHQLLLSFSLNAGDNSNNQNEYRDNDDYSERPPSKTVITDTGNINQIIPVGICLCIVARGTIIAVGVSIRSGSVYIVVSSSAELVIITRRHFYI